MSCHRMPSPTRDERTLEDFVRILLTGATGLIGSAVGVTLRSEGHTVDLDRNALSNYIDAPWTDLRPYADLCRAHAIDAERSPARALTRMSITSPCSSTGRGTALRTRRLLVRIQRGAPTQPGPNMEAQMQAVGVSVPRAECTSTPWAFDSNGVGSAPSHQGRGGSIAQPSTVRHVAQSAGGVTLRW
jgi:hypothetical protein